MNAWMGMVGALAFVLLGGCLSSSSDPDAPGDGGLRDSRVGDGGDAGCESCYASLGSGCCGAVVGNTCTGACTGSAIPARACAAMAPECGDPCNGDALVPASGECYQDFGGGCCGDAAVDPSMCGGQCPIGTVPSTSCTGFGSACLDPCRGSGAPAEQPAPPTCYTDRGDGCCGSIVTPECETCGGCTCPSGSVQEFSCTSFAPSCGATACTTIDDCTLTDVTCCGVCGEPTATDVIAIHESDEAGYRAEVCVGDVACVECAQAENPDLVATCDAGSCELVDIRGASFTSCTTDDDCRLRAGGCCECGATSWIALRTDGVSAYTALVCAPSTDCATCDPMAPTGIEAFCATDRHCDVRPI